MEDDHSNPPLMATYKHLFVDARLDAAVDGNECDLPVIDLALLNGDGESAERCREGIVRAASEWGFFQVTNHGVPQPLLRELHAAQVAVFRRPFQQKVNKRLLDFSPESYRWGTPTARCLEQLSWSEAYHIPMTPAPSGNDKLQHGSSSCRAVIEDVSTAMYKLAQKLATILARGMGLGVGVGGETMREETCFLRLNRYPPCAMDSGAAFGLCPHTDSDFLTILHQQDTIGGLQLLMGGRWVAVKPDPSALIVNVGDLLQAWSNDLYRSVEHRVMANARVERFSMAFFLCPSYDTVIGSRGGGGGLYRSFTFGEYRKQITEDVRSNGRKFGLQRFRLHSS
ncbi:gibberellin 2-beta-dioxygenase 5-like [Oryza brachyantha]|nr:gibberellin 2-beta-dioxygenase 5-like [Oryza brachyantha]